MPAISVDPATGTEDLRHPRRAKADGQDQRQGLLDRRRRARSRRCPPQPPGAVFDAEEQAKYRAFKEARRGAADYMAMEGEFAKYLEDVYSAPPVAREALTDECDILVVGAGFAGLLLWHKLQRRPGSTTSASARRAATSAAPGTGTATRASPATSSRTATSRCWRRWATSRR